MIMHGEPEAIGKVAAKLLTDAGFNVLGHLEGGLKAWKAEGLPVVQLPTLDVDELKERMDEFTVVDARDPFEFKYGHVPGSGILSWTEAWYEADSAEDDPPIAVICGDEIRSVLVASILVRKGKNAELVTGGMVDWVERDYPIEKGMG
jgi:rhodanese-related sulfurtransferase